jgi:hypothetical protein
LKISKTKLLENFNKLVYDFKLAFNWLKTKISTDPKEITSHDQLYLAR